MGPPQMGASDFSFSTAGVDGTERAQVDRLGTQTGKLDELNRLLRGDTDTSFVTSGGRAPSGASCVRYVIALDADTRLPRGGACRLVGTMAHPLNRPRFDSRLGRVIEGYALLQPCHADAADRSRGLPLPENFLGARRH